MKDNNKHKSGIYGWMNKTIYQSSIGIVFLGRLTPNFLKAVSMVWKTFQPREMALFPILNSWAILVKLHACSS